MINDIFLNLNLTEIDNGKDKTITIKNLEVILTSTINQKNNDENNITINLGQCENLLKNDYNISENDSLYILQIISKEIGMKIPKIEYEIYYPIYNSNNLTKLNLTSCKDTKLEISIKVKINDTIDKYNSSSDYYNNICHKTTSESGTDISLKDRRYEFVNNNLTICQENCKLIDYNYTKEKAKCSCDIKLNVPQNYDIKFDKKEFFKNFININNIANLNIMKCYKIVIKIKSLFNNNYGFYIISSVILIFLISLLIFLCKSYSKLNKDINNMISAIKKKGEEKTSKIQRTMQKTRTEINHKKKKNLIFQKNSKKKPY